MNALTDRLNQLRGAAPAMRHNARTIAALTANPGCARRALLDAAAVDKAAIARELGYPPQFGQSSFAITRGNSFEAMVKANGCAELLALLRDTLNLTIPEVAYYDLNSDEDLIDNAARHERTRQLLAQALDTGVGTLFDHPLLRLDIAGADAYLEPDVVALQIDGMFHVVEIKSFPVVDGQADPAQVAAAARQSAVYVVALRRILEDIGADPEKLVSHNVILVCTRDFTNRPVATMVDLRKQIAVISRQLSRLTAISRLVDLVPAKATFEPGPQLEHVIADIPARFAPECLSACELGFACRAEARACGSVDALGRGVCDELGGLTDMATVEALARGTQQPTEDQADIAEILRTAQRLRAELG
ncbi:hypothetical protein [Nocardia camponoti]|uniref:Secreted protein n=1 Tax=Nocardia camponoti TaxID=1616106 RepID=A0A917Q8H7_9NOCA|nr:hypothetical protein [Nocardia camponoti]GGK34439.1 hypothetical protein GCM10011591_02660 [Nocardia camponoti]